MTLWFCDIVPTLYVCLSTHRCSAIANVSVFSFVSLLRSHAHAHTYTHRHAPLAIAAECVLCTQTRWRRTRKHTHTHRERHERACLYRHTHRDNPAHNLYRFTVLFVFVYIRRVTLTVALAQIITGFSYTRNISTHAYVDECESTEYIVHVSI